MAGKDSALCKELCVVNLFYVMKILKQNNFAFIGKKKAALAWDYPLRLAAHGDYRIKVNIKFRIWKMKYGFHE